MPTCFYIECCPFPDECSKASRDRCRHCASYDSPEGARELFYSHLTKSNLHHHHTAEEIRDAMDAATVLEVDIKEEEMAPVPPSHPPQPKRARVGDGKWPRVGDSLVVRGKGPRVGESQPTTITRTDDDIIPVRRGQLKNIMDCLERAAASASHAIKISGAARTAFEEEHSRVQDCLKDVQRTIVNL